MQKLALLFGLQFLSLMIFAQNEKDSTDFGLDALLEKNVKQTEYISSASKYSQAVYESPNALNVITKNDINTFGYDKLSEVLSKADAIYINNDLNYQYIGFMGFGKPTDNNNRVQLLFDGHKLNDYMYNAIPIDELAMDIHSYDKVEVIKGPGSVLYGGSAMFGVINLIPRKTDKDLIPRIHLGYGSYNSKSISGITGYENENGFSFTLHGYFYKSDGRNYYFPEFDTEENNHGVVNNLDGELKRGIYASIRYGDFEIFGVSSYRYKEVPTASYDVDFGSLLETKDIYNFYEAKYTSNIGFDKQISIRLYYDQYKYSGLYIYGGQSTWDANDSKSFGTEIRLLWDPVPYDRIIIGGEFNKAFKASYDYRDDYHVYSSFNAPTDIYSLYFQNEFQLIDNIIFYFASRLDSYKNSSTNISPRATLIYSPDENNTLRFLAGTSYRTPAAYEKYFEDPTGGYRNNEFLTPERVLTYEISWNRRISKNISCDVNVYRNSISSFIENVISEEDSLQFYANNMTIKSYGIGVGLKADFETDCGTYINFQHQRSRMGDDIKLSAIPDNILKLGAYYKFSNYLMLGFEHRYESSKISVYGTQVHAIQFSSLNVFNKEKIFGLNFSIVIKNLFNNSVFNPGGLQHRQTVLPMPGRNYIFNIGYGI